MHTTHSGAHSLVVKSIKLYDNNKKVTSFKPYSGHLMMCVVRFDIAFYLYCLSPS